MNVVFNVILLHSVALCNFDLGIVIPSGATTICIEGLLLEGTFLRFTYLTICFGLTGRLQV
jgi:hypothetical protein